MTATAKRWKCPECEVVSDGTGLRAHMNAKHHTGDRIPAPDGVAGEVLDRAHSNSKRRKVITDAERIAKAKAKVVVAKKARLERSGGYQRPLKQPAQRNEFTIRIDNDGTAWLKIQTSELIKLLNMGGSDGA